MVRWSDQEVAELGFRWAVTLTLPRGVSYTQAGG